MDRKDVNCPGRGPARAWMPLAYGDGAREKKSGRQGVFSALRCTRVTAAAAPELTLSCFVKTIYGVYFVRRRMMSSIFENGRPIKVSYSTRSRRGGSDVSMEYCRCAKKWRVQA